MDKKKYISKLGYEYICALLENCSPKDKYYKLLKRKKKAFEAKIKKLARM